ncbi:MAG: HEAT repeat domain-containing protein [Pleurocapsa sp.]
MTYIKPEAVSNQSSLVKEILAQGSSAARQQNWLEVSNQLKLLPQAENRREATVFLLEPEDWHTAFDLALSMLTQADFQHQWEITKLLPRFGSKIVTPLSILLKDETVEAEVRWFICKILGDFPNQLVILTLVELLQQTTDSELIDIAGKTLIKIGDRAIDALVNLLSQSEHRRLAVQSLFYIRTPQTIAPLLEVATTDREPELRAIAIKALGSFHDHRVPPVLITALQDQASNVRKEAAIALGFRPDLCQELNLVAHLQPLLNDLNLEVCSQAAISLGRMKQDAATTALFRVLQAQTTPLTLKLDLVKALGWSEISSGISYLQQALTDDTELVTQEVITVLGRITAPELKSQSTQALINFWHSKDQSYSSQVRLTIANSLGELHDNSAQEVLQQLTRDSDRKVRLHAFAALRKLN